MAEAEPVRRGKQADPGFLPEGVPARSAGA